MIRSGIVFAGLCACAAGLTADPSVPTAATAAKSQYETEVADLQKQYTAALDDVVAEYTKKLDALTGKAKEAGNLDAVLVLKAEQDRVAKGDFGPGGKLPADAAKARQAFDAAAVKVRAASAAKLRNAHAGYIRELADLEKVETKADRLDSAVAVRTYRQQLEKAGPSPLAGPALAGPAKPFGWRFGTEKAQLIKTGGGTDESEVAVARGLAWLARQQRPNGAWASRAPGDEGSAGLTALALLPFLSAGESPAHECKYPKTVGDGLRYLVANQNPDGSFAKVGALQWHAPATLALCEAYGMTQDKAFRGPAQKAVDYIVRSQGKDGGWGTKPQQESNMPSLGYQIEALRAAHLSGLLVEPRARVGASRYLDKVTDMKKALYGNQKAAPTVYSTATALVARQFTDGWPTTHPAMAAGSEFLLKTGAPAPPWPHGVQYYYHASQLLYSRGGPEWSEQWNPLVRDRIVSQQASLGKPNAGSWDSSGKVADGDLFSTAYSLLTLETYYSYPPDKFGPTK